jgi:DNA-binding NarL/FixJ family response regulator
VLIVDDDPPMRVLLRAAMELDGRFEVVDEAEDGLRAIALAATHQPDVIVLDAMMPELNGIEAIPAIRGVSSRSRIVVFSAVVSDHATEVAIELGASAVVAKTAPIAELLDVAAQPGVRWGA